MPYIKKDDRIKFDEIEEIAKKVKTGGELNYLFTILCKRFIEKHGEKYINYATCISALECAKLELYRRDIAHYETTKIMENGDV